MAYMLVHILNLPYTRLISSVGIDPAGNDAVPDCYFAPLEAALKEEPGLLQVAKVALPQLVDAALQLGKLKPPEGLSYSLQQQSKFADALNIIFRYNKIYFKSKEIRCQNRMIHGLLYMKDVLKKTSRSLVIISDKYGRRQSKTQKSHITNKF